MTALNNRARKRLENLHHELAPCKDPNKIRNPFTKRCISKDKVTYLRVLKRIRDGLNNASGGATPGDTNNTLRQMELGEIQRQQGLIEETRRQHNATKRNKDVAEERVAFLQASLQASSQETNGLKTALQETKAQLANAQSQVKALKEQEQEAKKQMNTVEKQLTNLRAQHNRNQSNRNTTLNTISALHEKQKANAKKQLNNAQAQIKNLEKNKNNLTGTVTALRQNLKTARAQLKNVQSELSTLKEQREKAQGNVSRAQQNVKEVQEQLHAQRTNAASLKDQLQSEKKRVADLQTKLNASVKKQNTLKAKLEKASNVRGVEEMMQAFFKLRAMSLLLTPNELQTDEAFKREKRNYLVKFHPDKQTNPTVKAFATDLSQYVTGNFERNKNTRDIVDQLRSNTSALSRNVADRNTRINALTRNVADRNTRIGSLTSNAADRINTLTRNVAERNARIGALTSK